MADVVEKDFIADRQPAIDLTWCLNGAICRLCDHSMPFLSHPVQRGAVDLVGRGERQFVDEPDEARMLIGGRIGEREALDRVGVERTAGLADDESDRLLALDLVVDRHHRRLRDVGMALQHALDVGRIDILAAGDEHVVGAADEIVEAVGVAAEHVAGDVEAVRRDRRRHVRAVVIAEHQGRAFHFQHALIGVAVVAVDQPDLHLRMRIADRHFGLRQPLGCGPNTTGPRLGGAVGVGHGGLRQRAVQRLHQALAHRRRAHAHELDAGEVGAREQLRLAQHHGDHRRHRGEPGAAIAPDRLDVGARA